MARPSKDLDAAAELGATLMRLRDERHPGLAIERIARIIEMRFNRAMSTEQVRKFHAGDIDPNTAAMEDVVALASFYAVDPRELHPVIARRWEWLERHSTIDLTLLPAVSPTGWFGPVDQPTLFDGDQEGAEESDFASFERTEPLVTAGDGHARDVVTTHAQLVCAA